jgi:hypothetical protein
MTRDKAEAVITEYEALVEKALAILNEPGPPWGYVGETNFARLTFDGDMAILSHPQADSYYDSITIEEDNESFPAALLFMSDKELAAWRVEARAAYEQEQKVAAQQRLEAQEAEQRKAYEALKRKFG